MKLTKKARKIAEANRRAVRVERQIENEPDEVAFNKKRAEEIRLAALRKNNR